MRTPTFAWRTLITVRQGQSLLWLADVLTDHRFAATTFKVSRQKCLGRVGISSAGTPTL